MQGSMLHAEMSGWQVTFGFPTMCACIRTQSLHLGSNRITDMSEMDKLTALPCLLDCTLANNPLARKQLYRATAIQKLPFLRILDNKVRASLRSCVCCSRTDRPAGRHKLACCNVDEC